MKLARLPPVFALAACGAIVPGTAERLAGFSPLTAEPEDIAALVDLPEGLAIGDDGATLTFGATRSDTGQRSVEVFDLRDSAAEDGRTLLRVAEEDRARYRAHRDRLAGWERDAPEATDGAFSISVAACRVGSGPGADATVSVFVATEADGPFRPLLIDAPLDGVVELESAAAGGDCG